MKRERGGKEPDQTVELLLCTQGTDTIGQGSEKLGLPTFMVPKEGPKDPRSSKAVTMGHNQWRSAEQFCIPEP